MVEFVSSDCWCFHIRWVIIIQSHASSLQRVSKIIYSLSACDKSSTFAIVNFNICISQRANRCEIWIIYRHCVYRLLIKSSISDILHCVSSIQLCAVFRLFNCLVISSWMSVISSEVKVNDIESHATKLNGDCCNVFGFAVSSATHSSKALWIVIVLQSLSTHLMISLFTTFQSSS